MYCCCFIRWLFCFLAPASYIFSLLIFFHFYQVRHLGLRYTLLAFPSLCACAIVVVMIMPTLEVGRDSNRCSRHVLVDSTSFYLALTNSGLPPCVKVAFFALILIKAFSYSLNNPCKEMLYQPTSNSVSCSNYL